MLNGLKKSKEEPMDDTINDSGVASGSDCPSASPTSTPSTSPCLSVHGEYFSGRSKNQQGPPKIGRNSISPKKLLAGDNFNDLDEISVPKINSHGKVKVHKCKQCDFSTYTKLEYWEHCSAHIKSDKILKCPHCPFVTEYKHHLEYHLSNHLGTKPYKCHHCDYSCVNKSMLNSHLKSHSKVYQYRCSNCQYETKYCHSLKLHLRKYGHQPAMVLNPDGSPNPLPIIDVYGTRRGPKVKTTSESSSSLPSASNAPQVESQPPRIPFNPLVNPFLNQNGILPFPLPQLPSFPGGLPGQEFMMHLVKERWEELAKQNPVQPEAQPQENGALDLTNKSSHSSENGESDDENMKTAFDYVEVVENNTAEADITLTPEAAKDSENETESSSKNNNTYNFSCQYCGILFGDEIMFRIHMGYHGYNNPFSCNMCGQECEDKVNFFLHVARAAH